MRQNGSDGIDGPDVTVVVIVVFINAWPVHRVACGVGVRVEKMRVNLAGKRVLRVIGISVDVLEWGEEKRQQHCQNGLDGCCAAHR
jgi:hypothetical protein